MRLASHGTGGARRRMRYHCRAHRPLVYRGRSGDGLVFEVHADDGRTYTLMLDAGDVAALQAAGLVRTVAAVLDDAGPAPGPDTGGGRWPATRRSGHG